jgi:hypothetical protein
MINVSPNSLYWKGLKRVLLFYIIGIMVVGWNSTYAPPLSVIVMIFLFIVGMLWAMLNLASLLDPRGQLQSLGELTVHVIVLLISASVIIVKVGVI